MGHDHAQETGASRARAGVVCCEHLQACGARWFVLLRGSRLGRSLRSERGLPREVRGHDEAAQRTGAGEQLDHQGIEHPRSPTVIQGEGE